MTYQRFEDLPVWKAAIELAVRLFDLLEDPDFASQGDVINQLRRSSLSISQNIAEGFERGSTNELLQFIYIARGSAGETRSALRFIRSRDRWQHTWNEVDRLINDAVAISKQLRAWADSLQNSSIKGQRHLNDTTKKEYDRETRATKFIAKLRRIQNGEKAEDVLAE